MDQPTHLGLPETSLSETIKTHARSLGFDICRIVPVEQAAHADFFELWLGQGRAGEMGYLQRNVEKRRDPRRLIEPDPESAPLRSLIVLGVNYYQFSLPEAVRRDPSRGLIASYAWGKDYHEVIRPRLHDLDALIRHHTGRTTLGKALVDSGPVLERDWAERAGIGFFGKNCCSIRPRLGSWLLLATLGVPEVLAYDPPAQPTSPELLPDLSPDAVLAGLPRAGRYGAWRLPAASDETGERTGGCGRCTRCMDGCPTDAFVGPFHLDPQRCISYWTIETQSPVPRGLRPFFGNRIFGCDICQEVCPWNRLPEPRRPAMPELAARSDWIAPPLLEGFQPTHPYWLDDDAFRARFRGSPVRRAKRHGMLRNVCIALGNWAAVEPARPQVIDALAAALADPHPAGRGHAAWALGRARARLRDGSVEALLANALRREEDAWVAEELNAALDTVPDLAVASGNAH